MKKSFLIMALRCVSTTGLTRVAEGMKYLFLDDVISYSELSKRYRWLMLVKAHQGTISIKNSQPLGVIHQELEHLMKGYSELEGYDLSQGDPFLSVVEKRGLSAIEISKKNVPGKAIVNTNVLEEIVGTVMEYNFYYKHQEVLPAEFKVVEDRMQVLSKRDRWPGRGSWNAFVPKTDKPKKEFNLDFLSLYGPKSPEEKDSEKSDSGAPSDQKEETNPDKPKTDSETGAQKDEMSNGI
jgi:hypothetical protein